MVHHLARRLSRGTEFCSLAFEITFRYLPLISSGDHQYHLALWVASAVHTRQLRDRAPPELLELFRQLSCHDSLPSPGPCFDERFESRRDAIRRLEQRHRCSRINDFGDDFRALPSLPRQESEERKAIQRQSRCYKCRHHY